MYITAHAAAGAALGQFIPSIWLAFIAGFVSHLLLDMIPHGGEWVENLKFLKTRMQRIVVVSSIDLIGVIILTVYWINHSDISQLAPMLAAIAGSIAPDALWGLYEFTESPALKWYKKSHIKIQHLFSKAKINILQEFAMQIILIIICTGIIIIF